MGFKGGPTLNAAYWTQPEAVLAIGPSFRLGFNPGELIDFILGWGCIDVYGDDLEAKSDAQFTLSTRNFSPPVSALTLPRFPSILLIRFFIGRTLRLSLSWVMV